MMGNGHWLLYCSQVFDNYAVTVVIGGEPYTLGLFDTAGKSNIIPGQTQLMYYPH